MDNSPISGKKFLLTIPEKIKNMATNKPLVKMLKRKTVFFSDGGLPYVMISDYFTKEEEVEERGHAFKVRFAGMGLEDKVGVIKEVSEEQKIDSLKEYYNGLGALGIDREIEHEEWLVNQADKTRYNDAWMKENRHGKYCPVDLKEMRSKIPPTVREITLPYLKPPTPEERKIRDELFRWDEPVKEPI